MRMKLSLAIAFSHQARLLIMDEPTSGLDPVFRSELLEGYAMVKGERKYLDNELKNNLVDFRESSYGFEALTASPAAIRHGWGDSLLLERVTLEEIMLFTIRGDK